MFRFDYGTGCRSMPSWVISTRSPTFRPTARVSRYWMVLFAMRTPTRLVELPAVPPAAALAGAEVTESTTPVPATSAFGDGGTTTVPAAGAGATTTGAGGGATTTGGGAGVTLSSVAQPARTASAMGVRASF